MRKALVVGINDYDFNPLSGCINDANAIGDVLETNYDGTENFTVSRLTSDKYSVTKAQLFRSIRDLFREKARIALLFFSGHGGDSELGGYMVTSDAQKHDMGVALNEVIELANMATHIDEIVIIIDACHSGQAGNTNPLSGDIATLREGVSVLASSLKDQLSVEKNGQGLFTSVILKGLNGGAADILGQVTVAGLYNYADKVLGPFQQRPVFKTHITQLNSLKLIKPTIPVEELKMLKTYFATEDSEHSLSKEYEPTEPPSNPEKEAIFATLQRFTSSNLVKPIGEKHMYYAAMNNKSCGMTSLGKLYWRMIQLNKVG